jgi:hypothetical protein
MNKNLVTVSRDEMLQRIREEYLEMPRLRLTLPQAQRLWGLDPETCAQLLQSLADEQFLCRRFDGTYGRIADGTVQGLPVGSAGQPPPASLSVVARR